MNAPNAPQPDGLETTDDHECGDPHCGDAHGALPFRREAPKIGRNDPCSCGSGKKFKKCCLAKEA
jgi:preprotein translocase subunit SecA